MINERHVLLAEDNPHDIELMLAALAENHIANNVVVTRDGAETLDYLNERGKYAGRTSGNPIVLLLDLKMPKVDGLEVLRQVKSNPKLSSIPVVMLTSSNQESDLVTSYQAGVNAYVVKPVDFDKFISVVKDLSLFWVLTNEPPPGTMGRV